MFQPLCYKHFQHFEKYDVFLLLVFNFQAGKSLSCFVLFFSHVSNEQHVWDCGRTNFAPRILSQQNCSIVQNVLFFEVSGSNQPSPLWTDMFFHVRLFHSKLLWIVQHRSCLHRCATYPNHPLIWSDNKTDGLSSPELRGNQFQKEF